MARIKRYMDWIYIYTHTQQYKTKISRLLYIKYIYTAPPSGLVKLIDVPGLYSSKVRHRQTNVHTRRKKKGT